MKDIAQGADGPTIVGGRPDPVVVGGRPSYMTPGNQRQQRSLRSSAANADIALVNMNLLRFNVGGNVVHEVHPPLGLLYLSSVLEQQGWQVDYIDHQLYGRLHPEADPFDLDQVMRDLSIEADIVGFSCMANLLPLTILLARKLKSLHPDKTILLGGVGPFAVEEQLLERFPWIDVVVRGESENTILDLMEALTDSRRLAEVCGISYRSNGGAVVRNRDQPRIGNLDTIPFPAYDRLEMDLYDAINIVTNRGCPYPCAFCSVAPIWQRRASFRSLGNVLEEIRLLHQRHGVREILFQDEFFYSSEARMLQFCDLLADSAMAITWKCFGRANLVTERAMRRMAEAGCTQLRFGIESGSDRVLRRIVKVFDSEQARRSVRLAAEIFDSVETFFIWGFPFENRHDFDLSVALMEEFRERGVTILPSLLSLLPGTGLFDDLRKGGIDSHLTFHPELTPVFVLTGCEELGHPTTIPDRYRPIFDLVVEHPDLFTGFYLPDYEDNVLPKFEQLRAAAFV